MALAGPAAAVGLESCLQVGQLVRVTVAAPQQVDERPTPDGRDLNWPPPPLLSGGGGMVSGAGCGGSGVLLQAYLSHLLPAASASPNQAGVGDAHRPGGCRDGLGLADRRASTVPKADDAGSGAGEAGGAADDAGSAVGAANLVDAAMARVDAGMKRSWRSAWESGSDGSDGSGEESDADEHEGGDGGSEQQEECSDARATKRRRFGLSG